jgi:hypothetical protein
MGILMGGVIRDAVSHGPLPFANACVTATLHCYSTDGNGIWNNLSDGGAYAYSGVSVTCHAGGHYDKTLNMTHIAYYPDLGINGLWEVVELERMPEPPPSCCFTGDTRVLMADGSSRRIDQVDPADLVLGRSGGVNLVTGVDRPLLGDRRLHGFNAAPAFVTSEHPFLTRQGWKSVDPAATAAEVSAVRVERLRPGDGLIRLAGVRVTAAAGSAEDAVELKTRVYDLAAISSREAPHETVVYNLRLAGDHTFFANGFIVHNKGH